MTVWVGDGSNFAGQSNFRLALENGPGAANVMNVVEELDTIHPQYADSFTITYDA